MHRGVAVITGGSAGLGRASALSIGTRGWDVGVLARGEDGLKDTVEELRSLGIRATAVPADVADDEAVEDAATSIEGELGPITAWVNNAMTGVFGACLDIPAADFRRVTEVTYLGYVHGTRAALRRMVPRGQGIVVQVGSALAHRGIPLQSAYCGAKHAVQGFTDSVRAELHHQRSAVRICEVHVPALNTPQFRWVRSFLPNEAQPVPPIYQPEVAAGAIARVLEHPRREMWVGLPTVAALLTNQIAPGLLDRYLGWTGYEAQQTDEPLDPDRPFNLYAPVSGAHATHGVFDDRSKTRSSQTWATEHRGAIVGGVGLAVALTAARRSMRR